MVWHVMKIAFHVFCLIKTKFLKLF